MATQHQPVSPEYQRPVRHDGTVDEPTPNARQGVTHHNVRYVLAISTGVLAVLFAVIYLVYFAG